MEASLLWWAADLLVRGIQVEGLCLAEARAAREFTLEACDPGPLLKCAHLFDHGFRLVGRGLIHALILETLHQRGVVFLAAGLGGRVPTLRRVIAGARARLRAHEPIVERYEVVLDIRNIRLEYCVVDEAHVVGSALSRCLAVFLQIHRPLDGQLEERASAYHRDE